MEKFDEVLDAAKLRVMGLREGSITRTKLALEDIIHAIQLLSDEVANNQKIIDSAYNKGYDKGRKDGYEECIEKYDL